MKEELWNLYLQLQTSYAYGGTVGHSPTSEAQAGPAADYLARVLQRRALEGSLLIGPGGPNEVSVMMARLTPPVSVLTAHEPEARLIQERFPQLAVRTGDIHDMPFESGAFQFVFANNVLEHVFAPYIALMECRRVLGADGIGYFVLPSFAGTEGGRGPFHLHCLTQEVWTELLRKTGFVLVDVQVERGGEDPSGHYVHYKCAAKEPPFPHDQLLKELITWKATRS